MLSMKRFFSTFISCMLLLAIVVMNPFDLLGATMVHAKASMSYTPSSYPSRSAIDPQVIGYPSRTPLDNQANSYSNMLILNMRSVKLVKGTSVRLKVLNLPADYTVSFQSSNTKIASVSSAGKIKGKKKGEATVTATVKQNNRTVRKLTCDVVVGPAAVSIVIPKSKITLTLGKSAYVNYIVKPSNSTEVPIFKSSNKKVAKVSKTGVITTHSVGKATITATISNGKSDELTVIVNKK